MFTNHSVPVVAAASVVFYVASYHLFLFLRRQGSWRDVTFSLTCLAIFLFDLCCIGLYNADSVIEGVRWQRLQVMTLPWVGIMFLWFGVVYSGTRSRKIPYIFTFYLFASALVQVIAPMEWTWSGQSSIKTFSFPGTSCQIVYYEMLPAPLTILIEAGGLLLFLYGLWLGVSMYRKGNTSKAIPLLIAVILFMAGYANDVALNLGLINSLYLVEYAYMGIVVVMAQALSREVGTVNAARLELQKAERELAEAKALLSAAIEQTGAGILVLDARGMRVQMANSAALAMATRGGGRDQTMSLFPEDDTAYWEMLHTDGTPMEPNEYPLSRAIHEGEPVGNVEVSMRVGDNEERNVLVNAAPVRDSDGRVVAGVAVLLDTTERKKAITETQESRERYKALFESASDAIFIMKDGRFIDCNAKVLDMFHCARENIIGATPYDLSPPQQPDGRVSHTKALEKVQAALEGTPQSFEWRHRCPSGQEFDAEVSLNHLEIENSSHLLAIVRDITERRQAERERDRLEAQLRQAQKMEAIGALAGGIAHDFNNILSAIIGYAELADFQAGENEEVHGNIVQVLKAGNRAKELIAQILAFSRQTEQAKKPLRLQPIVEETAKLLRASIPSTIELRVRAEHDCPAVVADATAMHRLLMNLCTNAYQAMRDLAASPAPPRRSRFVLSIELERLTLVEAETEGCLGIGKGAYASLIVSDTGHGMSKHTLERIFEPYFSTRQNCGGTGLGLATVHSIVQSHGGAIRVYSEPGEGAAFHVYLPACPEDASAFVMPGESASLPRGTERVLLVDDEWALTDVGRKSLEIYGYHTTTCTNALEALDLYKRDPMAVDVVITDMAMPGMNGLELARRLLETRPDLPVILCTGFSESEVKEKALALGVRQFVMKPVVGRQLAEAVRRAVANGVSRR